MKSLVSVIIVHWNTPTHLKKLLSALSPSVSIEIVVVDNASEKSVNWIKDEFPKVILIQNKINRGYGFACNQGSLKVNSDWLLFLNPDVEINESQITELIEYAEKYSLVACSPEPNNSNYSKPVPSPLALLAEFTPLRHILSMPSTTHTLTGGCLLLKTDVFQEIGGWDERFFLWFEDSDLTKRLINDRYRIGWAPVAVNHEGGASFMRHHYQYRRDVFFNSLFIYAKKHFSPVDQFIARFIKHLYTSRKILPSTFDGVSIVVPNMKRKLLQLFFEKNKSKLHQMDELIIVSSALNPSLFWEFKKKYPQIRFIMIQKNRGFASTVNIGMRVGGGDWIGTINDDVILSGNWLRDCLRCADDKTGSLNPVIVNPKGVIESAGIDILKKGKARPRTQRSLNKCITTDATNAAAVIYNREALNRVGLFDERFGSYLEDIDLSLRLTRNRYKNIVSMKSLITHYGQSTSKQLKTNKNFLDFRNWIFVIIKNWGLYDFFRYFPAILMERGRNLWGILKLFRKRYSIED